MDYSNRFVVRLYER